MLPKLSLTFSRINRSFTEGEIVEGTVSLQSEDYETIEHGGVYVSLEGYITGGGFMERAQEATEYNSELLVLDEVLVSEPEKIELAAHVSKSWTFKIPIKALPTPEGEINPKHLPETYHGVRISVNYFITCEIREFKMRQNIKSILGGFMENFSNNGDLRITEEFFVHYPRLLSSCPGLRPISFTLTPADIQQEEQSGEGFSIAGHLRTTEVSLLGGFVQGEITVCESERKVRAVEVRLMRTEENETSEVLRLEIGSGDVPRGLALPIHLPLPSQFCCARLRMRRTSPCHHEAVSKVRFAVNLSVEFVDGMVVTESVPIKVYRY